MATRRDPLRPVASGEDLAVCCVRHHRGATPQRRGCVLCVTAEPRHFNRGGVLCCVRCRGPCVLQQRQGISTGLASSVSPLSGPMCVARRLAAYAPAHAGVGGT